MNAIIYRYVYFCAAHQLTQVPKTHKCATMHGHNYKIGARVSGSVDGEKGWVCDFGDLDYELQLLAQRLDHKTLNQIEGLENPTSENLALWLLRALLPKFEGLIAVTVEEDERKGGVVLNVPHDERLR